jgi:hypothetical protein
VQTPIRARRVEDWAGPVEGGVSRRIRTVALLGNSGGVSDRPCPTTRRKGRSGAMAAPAAMIVRSEPSSECSSIPSGMVRELRGSAAPLRASSVLAPSSRHWMSALGRQSGLVLLVLSLAVHDPIRRLTGPFCYDAQMGVRCRSLGKSFIFKRSNR